MPILIPSVALIIGFIVAPTLFVLSADFARASRRRFTRALVGAVSYSTLNIIWDQVAGGAFGLIGWRVSRRWPSPARAT